MRISRVGVVVCLGIFFASFVAAQESGQPPVPGGEPSASAAKPADTTAPGGYHYDPGKRRDPFVNLLIGRTLGKPNRKPGVQGMLISEVDLKGIVKDSQGFTAMLAAPDHKVYFVRVGVDLADGKVINITQTKVVFRQEIKDPLTLKPYRDIEKSLVPGEGAEEDNR